MDFSKVKRAWMISDIHFGVRSSSIEWIKIQQEYFNKFFIPTLKENKKDGDCLFVLGDIFESRQTLNIHVINVAIKIFSDISKVMPVVIIIGNHDMYNKKTSDINSSVVFSNIENVSVISEPVTVNTKHSSVFLMPWIEDPEEQEYIIKTNPADYMFCHADFYSMKYNSSVKIDDGIKPNMIKDYKQVFSGHIHYRQVLRNITMVGSPYQITRSDMANTKYIYLLDFETGDVVTYENKISPKFLKIKIDDLLDYTLPEINKIIENNFVDIIIESKWTTKFPYSLFIDSVEGYRKINYILASLHRDYDDADDDMDGEINILDLIKNYIKNLPYTSNTKKHILKKCLVYYKEAVRLQQENEIK